MNDSDKNEILSISKNLGEVALDNLIRDGLFKDIPIIGTGFSIMKLIGSVSDQILLTKIIRFINELDLKNQEEVNTFKEKYLRDQDYEKIGSRILYMLERADTPTKIKWLAKSLKIFIDREITRNEFLRISSIINNAYVEDVSKIIVFDERNEITSNNNLIESYIVDHLFSIGLLESRGVDGGNFSTINSGTIYKLNKFGLLMKEKIL